MISGSEWLLVALVVLLLFGAKKLPEMARSVGQSARVFKGEMKGMKDDDQARAASREAETETKALPAAAPAEQPQSTQTQPVEQPGHTDSTHR